jgi:ATP-binding cassette subfamily B protein
MTVWTFLGHAFRMAFAKPHAGALLLAGITVQVLFYLAIPLTYRHIFDDAIAGHDMWLLAILLAIQVGLFVLFGAGGVAHDWAAARIGASTAADLRQKLFGHLQAQGPGFYSRVNEGDVVAGFGPDVAAVETAMVRAFPSFIMRSMNITLSTALLFLIEWRIAVMTVCMMPLLVLASRPFSRRAHEMNHRRDAGQAQVAAFVQENVLTHLAIRTFNLRGERMRQLSDRLDLMRRDGFLSHLFTSSVSRSTLLSAWFLQIAVLGFGAWLATAGYVTTGVLIAFMGLVLNICGATDQLAQTIPFLMNGAGGLARINTLLGHEPELTDKPGSRPLSLLNRGMSLNDVTFGYTPDSLILRDVSFNIPAGKKVAIVGGSGSGKSTVLSLLVRLHDPHRGSVFYDGTDLREAQEDSFRQHTSIVLQNTALFDTSIRENIRSGRLDASDAEVEEAAKAAKLHDVILGLPAGYDTKVGLQGGLLSGGQRQRVAIARALLRRSNVLFLDEASSALDAATEQAINETLEEVTRGWTVVSVTHRLQHITNYDLIIVMEQGKVIEQGTHAALLARNGAYAALWKKQSGFSLQDGEAAVTPDRLRAISFLADCSPDVLAMLSTALVSESFPAGRAIFEEGDPGNKLYIIARGQVENYVQWGEDRETVLSVMEDGDWFGELALIKPVPRTWCARTTADTICLTLDRNRFLALLDRDGKLKDVVEKTALARSAELQQAIFASVEE